MKNRKIVIVSNDSETRDGLGEYLRRAGALPTSTSLLDDDPVTGTDAVVLFVDDYPRESAQREVARLRERGPATRLVLVTQYVDDFAPSRPTEGRVVVLRRPAWGWALLDALREAWADGGRSHA